MTQTFEDLFERADALFNSRRYAAAKPLYREAIETYPQHPDAHTAAVRVQYCDDLSMAGSWYGEDIPTHLALGILGSVSLTKLEPPYVHHVLTGKAAYEAFHLYRYLSDLTRVRTFPCLLSPSFTLLYLAMIATKNSETEFAELGCSMYDAFEKLEGCRQFVQKLHPQLLPVIRHFGVELSDKLRFLALNLHQGIDLTLFSSWRDIPVPKKPRFSVSIGVGNYAFPSSEEYVEWLSTCRASIIRESFTTNGDLNTPLMGKRFTRFDIADLERRLSAKGFRCSLLGFSESTVFLYDGGDGAGRIFLDAWLFVHRMSDAELSDLVRLVDICHADHLPMFWDPPPSIEATVARLLGHETISSVMERHEWKRYSGISGRAKPIRDRRFDFSSSMVLSGIATHQEVLSREYGDAFRGTHALGKRVLRTLRVLAHKIIHPQ